MATLFTRATPGTPASYKYNAYCQAATNLVDQDLGEGNDLPPLKMSDSQSA